LEENNRHPGRRLDFPKAESLSSPTYRTESVSVLYGYNKVVWLKRITGNEANCQIHVGIEAFPSSRIEVPPADAPERCGRYGLNQSMLLNAVINTRNY
jgi:hypothetical protein